MQDREPFHFISKNRLSIETVPHTRQLELLYLVQCDYHAVTAVCFCGYQKHTVWTGGARAASEASLAGGGGRWRPRVRPMMAGSNIS